MSSIYKVLTEEEWKHAFSLGYVVTKLDNDDCFTFSYTSERLLDNKLNPDSNFFKDASTISSLLSSFF